MAQNSVSAATIYDVARRAGVSHQTVTRYLKGFEGIRPATKQRVQEALTELDYHPNLYARALRLNDARRLVLFVHELAETGPNQILLAASHAAREAGFLLEIVGLDLDDDEASAETIRRTDQQYVAGMLAFAPTRRLAELFAAITFHAPIIMETNGDGLAGPPNQGSFDRGTELLIDHLAGLGHRRLFLLSGPAGWFSSDRREATARSVAARHGMEVVGVKHGNWSAGSGYDIVREISVINGATAVVAANDEMAMGALLALAELGISVPGEVSVVGYDDLRASAYYQPPLTTIRVDFDNAGRIAIDRLLTMMGRKSDSAPAPAGPSLIVRRSTASPPGVRAPRAAQD